MLGTTAAVVDRAATLAASAQTRRRRKRNRSESLSHEKRLETLAALAALYPEGDGFFQAPGVVSPRRERVRALDGGVVEDMRWDSGYRPFLSDVADRYRGGGGPAAVRLWRHHPGAPPRPVLILGHGYMAGQHQVEERVWPSSWLFRGGLDLAYFVLPHHGVRGARGMRPPRFPGSDPRITVEGFRQAMYELQSLVGWFLDAGHPRVGIMGMSLGGYTTSLAATVESRLHCAVPVIPLTSIADFARDQGRLGSSIEEETLQHQALDAVHRVVSPLHRAPVVPADRLLIVAAEADRITPVAHARRLGDHFGVSVETWHGGHLLQFGRREKFRRIGRFLRQHDMLGT